jgi:hypothetical protein
LLSLLFFSSYKLSAMEGLSLLYPLPVQRLQLPDEEQISDLLDGDEGIGEAGGPEEGPEVVDFAAELGGEHVKDEG